MFERFRSVRMKEFINQKLSEIKKSREQLVANLNALIGAEQAYNELLAELDKGETDEHDKC